MKEPKIARTSNVGNSCPAHLHHQSLGLLHDENGHPRLSGRFVAVDESGFALHSYGRNKQGRKNVMQSLLRQWADLQGVDACSEQDCC